MKKNYILLAVLTASVGFFSFQHSSITEMGSYALSSHIQGGGGQPGFTGAPGENNCTQCHVSANGVQDGVSENALSLFDGLTQVTEYVPGTTYIVNLDMVSNPAVSGFSATVLDANTAMAGTLVGSSFGATQDFTNVPGTRTYVSHISSASPSTFWTWNWTAPTAGTGAVTFYVATNAANGNNQQSGDVIYLSTHTFPEANASVESNTFDYNFKAGYNVANREIVVDFNSKTIDDMFVNVVNMNGQSVYSEKLGKSELGGNSERVRLPQEIEGGIYVVHFFVGNKAMSSKIMVQ